jgi:hypothetical protein
MIRLISGGDKSLFVARRLLRDLVTDEQAMRFEALVHYARMRALMDIHEVDDYDVSSGELTRKIARFLMLRQGKLVDDLVDCDERIVYWVRRLADGDAQSTERQLIVSQTYDLMSEPLLKRDQMALAFIQHLLLQGTDDEVAECAAEVLRTGYLDQQPQLRT